MVDFIIFGAGGMLAYAIKNHPFFKNHIALNSKEGDITDFKLIDSIISEYKPKYLINCAAYTDVTKAESDYSLAYSVNAQGSKNLATLSDKHKCQLIHFSTDYVFKGDKNIQYTEDMSLNPVNAYGKSKAEGEVLISQFTDTALIIRVSWLYGANGKNFVSTISEIMKNRPELKIVSDQFGKTTYTLDAANALEILIRKQAKGIFHFANDEASSRYEFTKKIYEILNTKQAFDCNILPIKASEYPDNTPRPTWSILNTDKFKAFTGEKITHWEKALKSYLDSI